MVISEKGDGSDMHKAVSSRILLKLFPINRLKTKAESLSRNFIFGHSLNIMETSYLKTLNQNTTLRWLSTTSISSNSVLSPKAAAIKSRSMMVMLYLQAKLYHLVSFSEKLRREK